MFSSDGSHPLQLKTQSWRRKPMRWLKMEKSLLRISTLNVWLCVHPKVCKKPWKKKKRTLHCHGNWVSRGEIQHVSGPGIRKAKGSNPKVLKQDKHVNSSKQSGEKTAKKLQQHQKEETALSIVQCWQARCTSKKWQTPRFRPRNIDNRALYDKWLFDMAKQLLFDLLWNSEFHNFASVRLTDRQSRVIGMGLKFRPTLKPPSASQFDEQIQDFCHSPTSIIS